MNGKERLLAALTVGLDRDFPVVVPYLKIFLRDHWEEVTDKPWWSIWEIERRLEVEEDLQEKLGIDWVQCSICPTREWRRSHKVEVLGGRVFLIDLSSGSKTEIRRPPVGGWPSSIDREPLVKSVDEVEERVEVVPGDELVRSGRLDYARMVVERFGSEKFIYANVGTPYWRAITGYMGFRGMIRGIFRRPRLVEALLERVTEQIVEEVRAYAEVGVDGVWIEDCLSSASEISTEHFRRFALPYVKDVASEVRKTGMKSIYYFCGDVHDRLEYLLEVGADAISLEESKKNFQIDIEWVNEVVSGRCCIFGNIDSLRILQDGTLEELEREVKRQIEVGREHGKFVVSLGSPVTPRTPVRRVREYVEIARRYSQR